MRIDYQTGRIWLSMQYPGRLSEQELIDIVAAQACPICRHNRNGTCPQHVDIDLTRVQNWPGVQCYSYERNEDTSVLAYSEQVQASEMPKGVSMFKGVQVVFSGGHNPDEEYSFLTKLDLTIGDKVLVDTINGFRVATVVQVTAQPRQQATKFAFMKVDVAALEACLEELQKLKELEEMLDAKVNEYSKSNQYLLLARHDPAVAKLLKEYMQLQGLTVPEEVAAIAPAKRGRKKAEKKE